MNHPSAAPHPASRPAKHSSEEASRSSAATRTQHLSLTPLLAGGSSVAAASSSWRTRSLYATARYVGKFIWWRIVRYGKYLALGAVTATLGGTFLGTLVSGASIFVAPTAAMGFVIAGGLAVAKVSFKGQAAVIAKGTRGSRFVFIERGEVIERKEENVGMLGPQRVNPSKTWGK